VSVIVSVFVSVALSAYASAAAAAAAYVHASTSAFVRASARARVHAHAHACVFDCMRVSQGKWLKELRALCPISTCALKFVPLLKNRSMSASVSVSVSVSASVSVSVEIARLRAYEGEPIRVLCAHIMHMRVWCICLSCLRTHTQTIFLAHTYSLSLTCTHMPGTHRSNTGAAQQGAASGRCCRGCTPLCLCCRCFCYGAFFLIA